jgi:DNA-binding response OmpR family regulator
VRHTAAAAEVRDYGVPAAVLVDPGEAEGDPLAVVAGKVPESLLIVMAGRDSLLDRVQALQAGARSFLQKPVDPDIALEAVRQGMASAGQAVPVLAVDDDPQVLDALRTLLQPDGVELHGELDPLRFWSTLQRVQPQLLILDVDMPQLNGIELCRVVRADPRWARLPVVFLTARADRDTLMRVFAAGADDYLTKPIVGPELSVRIRARLERARMINVPRAAG